MSINKPGTITRKIEAVPTMYELDVTDSMARKGTTVSLAFAFAEILDVPVTEVGSLSEFIDTDALDAIFVKNGSRWLADDVEVSFRAFGYLVTARSTGTVVFEEESE